MTAESIGEEICREVDDFARDQMVKEGSFNKAFEAFLGRLEARISSLDPSLAGDALLWILRTKTGFVHQDLAGLLLCMQESPCRITLEEFVSTVCPNFNASAEHTVRYAVQQFGMESVKSAVLERVHSAAPDSREYAILKTFAYWLGIDVWNWPGSQKR